MQNGISNQVSIRSDGLTTRCALPGQLSSTMTAPPDSCDRNPTQTQITPFSLDFSNFNDVTERPATVLGDIAEWQHAPREKAAPILTIASHSRGFSGEK